MTIFFRGVGIPPTRLNLIITPWNPMISRHLPRQVHGMLHDVPRWLGCFGCWAVVASPKVCRRYHNVYGKIMRKGFEMGCFLIFHVKITRDMQRCSQLGISCEEMWCQRMWTQQWPPSRPNAPFSSWIGAPLASSVASTISHLLQLARWKKQDHEFWEIFWNYPPFGNVSISCMNIKVVLIFFLMDIPRQTKVVPGGDLAKVMRACCMISNSTVPLAELFRRGASLSSQQSET